MNFRDGSGTPMVSLSEKNDKPFSSWMYTNPVEIGEGLRDWRVEKCVSSEEIMALNALETTLKRESGLHGSRGKISW